MDESKQQATEVEYHKGVMPLVRKKARKPETSEERIQRQYEEAWALLLNEDTDSEIEQDFSVEQCVAATERKIQNYWSQTKSEKSRKSNRVQNA